MPDVFKLFSAQARPGPAVCRPRPGPARPAKLCRGPARPGPARPGPARPAHTRPRPGPCPMCLNCFQPRSGPGPQYVGPGPARPAKLCRGPARPGPARAGPGLDPKPGPRRALVSIHLYTCSPTRELSGPSLSLFL